MKNLGLRRLLTVSAAGSLLLGVQGCGDSDESLAKIACKAVKKCDQAAFDDEFDNVGDCVDEYADYLEDQIEYYTEGLGKDCEDAFRKSLKCAAKEYKATCSYDDQLENCESEIEDAAKECGELNGGYDYDYDYDYYEYN